MSSRRVMLGTGGLEISPLVYGVYRWLNNPQPNLHQSLQRLVSICIEHGITTFDHADIYGSYQVEELFGSLVSPELRPRLELISKCGIKMPSPARPDYQIKSYDTSAAHIRASVERSLQNLRTDYLDLLLIHRPNPLMDAEVVAGTAEELRKEGKIRAFGVSNFSPPAFDLLQSHYRQPLATNQIEINPLRPEVFFDGTLDHAQRQRYRPMAWAPLAAGQLSQKPLLAAELQKAAQLHRCSPEAVAIAWLRHHPAGIIPVIGSTHEARLLGMMQAQDVRIDDTTWFAILQAGMEREVP